MSFVFDANTALAKLRSQRAGTATPAITATVSGSAPEAVARKATIAGPDPGAFEERAAILEFEAGMTQAEAEDMAARSQGFDNASAYFVALAAKGVKE